MKKVGIAVAVLLVLVIVARIGLGIWGGGQLSAIEEGWRADIARERDRVAKLRQPVVRGTALDENAVDRYRKAIDAIDQAKDLKPSKATGAIADAMSKGPFKPLSPEVVELLDAHRSEIALIRQGTRCSKVDWRYEWEKGFALPLPPLLPCRTAANLLILEGRERAQAGDARGAYDRYLDAARFGCDLSSGGPLISQMIGIAICSQAFNEIARLAASDPKGEPKPLASAEAELAKLEPCLPSFALAIHGERVNIGSIAIYASANEIGGTEASVADWVLPGKAILANAHHTLDPCLREIEDAAGDRKRCREVSATVAARCSESSNPIVAMTLINFEQVTLNYDDLLARYRLARSAIAIERAAVALHYPKTFDAPVDPLDANGAKLRYKPAADELGYKVWSVGRDGKDDGGKASAKSGDPGDIVIERASPQASSDEKK